jgi:hypothetical protein
MKKPLLLFATALLAGSAFSQTIIDESFDGTSLPDGWTKTQNNPIGWVFGSPATLSSTYWTIPAHDGNCAASNDDVNDNNSASHDASADYLITPSVDLTDVTSAVLTFDIYNSGQWGSTAFVRVNTDGGEDFAQIQQIPTSGEWQTINVVLDAYVGNSDVRIAFHHNDNDLWAGGVAVDNVKIAIPLEVDAAMASITTPQYVQSNSDVTVAGVITNVGLNDISSITIDWSASNGQTGTHTFDGLNVGLFETYAFSHPDAVAIADVNVDLTVTIASVNGEDDQNLADNELALTLNPLLFVPERKVLIEQATGTWCGWCPRGHVNAEFMNDTYPNSINVAVHNSDPMANSTYDNGIGAIIGGYPSGLVDRFFNDVDPGDFEDLYLQRIQMPTIASVGVQTGFNPENRQLSITIEGTFAVTTTGNYRLNAIVVEDNITGSGSGYNQTNYYSGGGAGPMGGYESLPDPVPANQMVYHMVGRRILGGWNGTVNSIPSSVEAGVAYSQEYSFTVPTTYDENEIMVVGLIIDNTTGEIVNAERSSGIVSARNVETNDFDFEIYPNPTNDISNVLLSLEKPGMVRYDVYDISGKRVISESKGLLAQGEYLHTIDVSALNSGLYFVTIAIGESQITKKLSVY